MTEKREEVHAIVSTTVRFPNRIPQDTAQTIAYDVEQMMFQTVAVINNHYKQKLGIKYDVLHIGLPGLDEFLTPAEIANVTFH